MARLHLLIDLNEVTDAEFRALCDAARGRQGRARRATAARAPLCATAATAICAPMRRAWHARRTRSRRGGRRRAGQ